MHIDLVDDLAQKTFISLKKRFDFQSSKVKPTHEHFLFSLNTFKLWTLVTSNTLESVQLKKRKVFQVERIMCHRDPLV